MPTNDQQNHDQRQPDNTPQKPELGPAANGNPRLAWLRTWWREAWNEDGFLYRRWDELLQTKHAGWHEIANWIKATGMLVGISLVIMTVDTAGDIASTALHSLSAVPDAPTGDGHGLGGTVDHPIRTFLTHQAAHLNVTPGALYTFWQLAGLLGLVGGFLHNAGARITWMIFGAGSLAMIWSASPPGGRAAATGLAALMWAIASTFALRGLTLRPIVHNHPPQHQFNPALHIHASLPASMAPENHRDRDTTHHALRP